MTKGADMYRLQCLDSERDGKRRRLSEVRTALGENEALEQAHQALESAQAKVRESAVRQRDLELETQGLADKIAHEEKQLYGGVITNPKELGDLQAEIAALRRRQRQLEEELLVAMIELDEAEAICTQARQHLDAMQADWSAQQADLLGEQEALQGELAEIEQARGVLLPSIDAGDLATYQALRRRKGGVAVVRLSGGACGGCGVAIPPGLEWQLREGKQVTCSNCERIVVRV